MAAVAAVAASFRWNPSDHLHHPGHVLELRYPFWSSTLRLLPHSLLPRATNTETDDFCYNVVRDPVHINDLNATILHALGIDHERFTFPYQGLDQRLTGVEGAKVERRLLA